MQKDSAESELWLGGGVKKGREAGREKGLVMSPSGTV